MHEEPAITRPEPGLIRLCAPNPSPMTERGTNTYLLGHRAIAVIDPGPALPVHLAAILAAVPAGAAITHIFVTHAHQDHSPLAPALARATGASVHAFGTATAGRTPAMQALTLAGTLGGGEGVDEGFTPDVLLADGETLTSPGPADPEWTLTAHHTPGHMANHLCFAWEDRIFTGDQVMGWASSLISPPDGDLAAYRTSLARLASLPARVLYPGHGQPVETPAARIAHLIRHRAAREAQVLAALTPVFQPLPALLARAYADTDPALHPAALRNLLAHLIDLTARNLAEPDGPITLATAFRSP